MGIKNHYTVRRVEVTTNSKGMQSEIIYAGEVSHSNELPNTFLDRYRQLIPLPKNDSPERATLLLLFLRRAPA